MLVSSGGRRLGLDDGGADWPVGVRVGRPARRHVVAVAARRVCTGGAAAVVAVVAAAGAADAAVAVVVGLGRDEALLHPLLLLHAPVLEPDLDLGLVQLERGGDLDPPRAREILVEVELLLQLRQLLRREVGPPAVVDAARPARHEPEVHRFGGWKRRNWRRQILK